MKILKSDRPAMEELLTQEADLDSMVSAVFTTAVDIALARPWYIVVIWLGEKWWFFGPYESEAVAKKHAGELQHGDTSESGVYYIQRIFRRNET